MIKTISNVLFDRAFWNNFTKIYWEKKPVYLKKAHSSLSQIGSEKIFDWLVQYSDLCRETNTCQGLKFYINGESQYQDEVLQSLPVKTDKSLLGYHQRMEKLFPDYCLVCDELIQVSGSDWNLLGDFLKGLYDCIGLSNRQSEIGLYLGNYKKTPFGVHVDGCGVISIPVVGTKKFRLWSDTYVKRNPDLELAFDYKKHVKHSDVIVASVGDITYWPSKSWHIAESDGKFSATLSIGIWVDQPLTDVLGQLMTDLIVKNSGLEQQQNFIKSKKSIDSKGQLTKLPSTLKKSILKMEALSKNEMSDAITTYWLSLNSRNGFKSAVRPDIKLNLNRKGKMQLVPGYPILWAKLKSGLLCLASHGQLIYLKNTPEAVRFIKILNSGKLFSMNDLSKKIIFKKEAFKILQILFQMRRVTQSI